MNWGSVFTLPELSAFSVVRRGGPGTFWWGTNPPLLIGLLLVRRPNSYRENQQPDHRADSNDSAHCSPLLRAAHVLQHQQRAGGVGDHRHRAIA
jgi:hypothetical protein